MQTSTTTEDIVRQKALELCETIVRQPEFENIRRRIDAFMGDQNAQRLYQSLDEKGHQLHEKQHQGLPLADAEITAFEAERDSFMRNPVAKDFVEAQEEMQNMQREVGQYVSKTFELGRVPSDADFDSGSCGHGCGCHH